MSVNIISHDAYGMKWPDGFSKFQAELLLYASDEHRNSPKALAKHEHLENAIREVIPDEYLKWHKWLRRALEAWCYEPVVSEWGCSSVGKSSDYGLLALFDVLADCANTKTVIVTNPLEAHWFRCFKYANYYHSLLPKPFQWLTLKRQNPIGLIYDHGRVAKQTGQQQAEKQTGIICHSNAAGDTFEDMKRRIGDHEKRMRFIVDEPQGCSDAVLKLQVNMSAGEGVDYIERFLGNPSGRTDPLGQHSRPSDDDWKKTETLDEWETARTYRGKTGKCYVRDARKSPAFDDPKTYWFLFGPQNQKDAKANYGEESAEYWTYGIGRLKGEGSKLSCITEPDVEAYNCYREVVWHDSWTDYAGLDAASEGGNDNMLYRVRVGRELNGRTVAVLVECEKIRINANKPDKSGQISDQVNTLLDKWNIPLNHLAGDTTGNQGPIFDRIEADRKRKEGKTERVFRVNASGFTSSDAPIFKGSPIIRKERYYNRATELFYNVVVACEKQQLIVRCTSTKEVDSELVKQLTTRQKEPPSEKLRNKIKIERKQLWKDRNENQSPDRLDAVQQVLAMLVEKNILVLNEGATDAKTKTDKQNGNREKYITRQNRRKRIARRY